MKVDLFGPFDRKAALQPDLDRQPIEGYGPLAVEGRPIRPQLDVFECVGGEEKLLQALHAHPAVKGRAAVIENLEVFLLQRADVQGDPDQLEPDLIHQHAAEVGILGKDADPRVAAVVEVGHQIELNVLRPYEAPEGPKKAAIALAATAPAVQVRNTAD